MLERVQGRSGLGRWPPVCGALAAVLQANFLLEIVLPGHLPIATSLVSELSAHGQPWSWVYRTGDLLAAALTLEVAWLVGRRPRPPWCGPTAWLVAVYAVGLGASALVPTPCVDALGRCGGHVVLESTADLADRVHDLVSILSAFALLVASGSGAGVLRHRGHLLRARLLLGTGVLAAALGALDLVQITLDVDGGQGVVQRVQVALTSVLVALLAEGLGDPRPAPTGAGRATGAGGSAPLSPRARSSPPAC